LWLNLFVKNKPKRDGVNRGEPGEPGTDGTFDALISDRTAFLQSLRLKRTFGLSPIPRKEKQVPRSARKRRGARRSQQVVTKYA
jgi:hypothetical protein